MRTQRRVSGRRTRTRRQGRDEHSGQRIVSIGACRLGDHTHDRARRSSLHARGRAGAEPELGSRRRDDRARQLHQAAVAVRRAVARRDPVGGRPRGERRQQDQRRDRPAHDQHGLAEQPRRVHAKSNHRHEQREPARARRELDARARERPPRGAERGGNGPRRELRRYLGVAADDRVPAGRGAQGRRDGALRLRGRRGRGELRHARQVRRFSARGDCSGRRRHAAARPRDQRPIRRRRLPHARADRVQSPLARHAHDRRPPAVDDQRRPEPGRQPWHVPRADAAREPGVRRGLGLRLRHEPQRDRGLRRAAARPPAGAGREAAAVRGPELHRDRGAGQDGDSRDRGRGPDSDRHSAARALRVRLRLVLLARAEGDARQRVRRAHARHGARSARPDRGALRAQRRGARQLAVVSIRRVPGHTRDASGQSVRHRRAVHRPARRRGRQPVEVVP